MSPTTAAQPSTANAAVESMSFDKFLKYFSGILDVGGKPTSKEIERLVLETKKDPKNSYGQYILGRYYESVNFGTLAAQQYQNAFELDPKNSKAMVSLARVKLRLGAEEESEKLMADAMNKFPNDVDVLVTAALYMQRKGDYKLADACYSKALKLAPPTSELLGARAELLYHQGEYVAALRASQAALRMNPKNLLAKSVRGKCLALSQQYDRAYEPLASAYNNLPVNDDIAAMYADTAVKSGHFFEALEPMLVAMSLSVKTAPKLLYYKKRVAGLIASLTPEQVSEQIKAAEMKLRGAKAGNFLFFCLGDVFDRMHRPADAMICYQRGLQKDPNYARGHLRLGMDYEDVLGDYENALKCYENALILSSQKDDEIRLRCLRMRARVAQEKRDVAWLIKTNSKRAKARKLRPAINLEYASSPGENS
ncbi:MAG: tetratricopeptide repeat protein [Candidatus Obscuribacterales bacterium]|nr:tetratricopeptide repeat protein [Candidatus Obscuribacterales bacterium]